MARIIEAKAIISGEDRLSGVIDKVNSKLRQVGKGAKISAEIERLNRSLGTTKAQLKALDRVRSVQSKVDVAKLGLAGAEANASRISSALAAATKAQDTKAIADLTAQHRVAQRAVTQAAGAVDRQAASLQSAKRELNAFGTPITNLTAHENALRQSVERATAAIDKESAALARLERRETTQARWDARRAGRRDAQIERASQRPSERARRSVGREAADGLGGLGLVRGLAPYVAPVLIGAEMRREIRTYADLEKAMTSLGVTAEASDDQVRRATEQFRREGPALGATAKEMAGAGELYVAAGLDFDTATGSVAKTVKASKASGGELNDLASAGIAAIQQFGFTADSLDQAFDIMAKGGKEGRYELKNMARDLPSVGAGAKRLGLQGREGLAKTVAALETIREVVGTPEEAANRWENVVQKIFLGETQKNFKKMGINLEKEIKDGAVRGKDALDVVLDATQRATGGDEFKLAKLFNDQQAQQGVQALLKNREKFVAMTGKILREANGTIATDYERVAKTTSEGMARLSASFDRVTGRLGEALAPAAGRIADQLDKALEKIDRGETLLDRWEKERRAREEAAGRDPDAAKKEYEAEQREQQERILDFERRLFGNDRGLEGALFPSRDEIDAGVRKAREEGLKEKADAERARAETAAQARAKQTNQELRSAKPPIGSPLRKATVAAMDAEEADRLGSLTRELDGIGDRAQLDQIQARLKRLEGPGFGDFGKADRKTNVPTIRNAPAEMPGGSPALGRGFSLDPRDMGGRPLPAPAPVPAAPLPPQRPPEWNGGDRRAPPPAMPDLTKIEARLAPDQRLEATIKPDQITAKVGEPVPVNVTGNVTETVQHQHQHTITLNTELLRAEIRSVTSQTMKTVPLTSSGARPGAVSMPGAAAPPGAQ